MAAGRLLQYGSERRNPLGGQHHRQQAVLEAVVEKYVAEARRQHSPNAVIVERPHGSARATIRSRNCDPPPRCGHPGYASWLSTKSGFGAPASLNRKSWNSKCPQPSRRLRHRKRAGMIWSVSMFGTPIGTAAASRRANGSITSSSGIDGHRSACRQWRRPPPLRGSRDGCGPPCPGGRRSCGWTSRHSVRPGATRSPFIPTHIEHPASRHSNPARLKIASRPSASACAFTRPEPGTAMAGMTARRPSSTFAAARRSSMRLLVQEPMKTRSIAMSESGVPGLRSM